MDPDKSIAGGDIGTSVVFLSPQPIFLWETKTVMTPNGTQLEAKRSFLLQKAVMPMMSCCLLTI